MVSNWRGPVVGIQRGLGMQEGVVNVTAEVCLGTHVAEYIMEGERDIVF